MHSAEKVGRFLSIYVCIHAIGLEYNDDQLSLCIRTTREQQLPVYLRVHPFRCFGSVYARAIVKRAHIGKGLLWRCVAACVRPRNSDILPRLRSPIGQSCGLGNQPPSPGGFSMSATVSCLIPSFLVTVRLSLEKLLPELLLRLSRRAFIVAELHRELALSLRRCTSVQK
jgi:hypothetical protein